MGPGYSNSCEELDSYAKLFEPAFGRRSNGNGQAVPEKGLLGPTQRKTVERMALELGQNVRDMQAFCGAGDPWRKEAAVLIHQGLVARRWGSGSGIC